MVREREVEEKELNKREKLYEEIKASWWISEKKIECNITGKLKKLYKFENKDEDVIRSKIKWWKLQGELYSENLWR